MHLNSKLLFERYAKEYFHSRLRVLEIGPDGFPSTYQSVIGDDALVWDTLDIVEHPNLTYRALDEYRYPVPDAHYDIVLAGNVLEHVRKIWLWIKELARICKPGGLVITVNPVSWPYHQAPIDCWRVFPEGMEALYEEAKLQVIISVWDSLEVPNYRRYLPGMSLDFRDTPKGRLWRRANLFLGKLGWPVERAYDTITIGRK
jgi:SAM-dependent methyltransferase